MIVDKYLVIAKNGSVVIREREPRLSGNEIALRLRMEVPDGLFQRPVLLANMVVPEAAVPKGKVNVMMTDNIEKIIKEATGLTMRVTVEEQEEEKS